jgi:hypothetical protein
MKPGNQYDWTVTGDVSDTHKQEVVNKEAVRQRIGSSINDIVI